MDIKEISVSVQAGFNWLRKGSSGGLISTRHEPAGAGQGDKLLDELNYCQLLPNCAPRTHRETYSCLGLTENIIAVSGGQMDIPDTEEQ
jgi:hypothetical protein